MNNEKLGAAPQMYAGRDAKQAIKFAWPYIYTLTTLCCLQCQNEIVNLAKYIWLQQLNIDLRR